MNNTYLTKPAAKQTHLLTALLMVVVVKIQKKPREIKRKVNQDDGGSKERSVDDEVNLKRRLWLTRPGCS